MVGNACDSMVLPEPGEPTIRSIAASCGCNFKGSFGFGLLPRIWQKVVGTWAQQKALKNPAIAPALADTGLDALKKCTTSRKCRNP